MIIVDLTLKQDTFCSVGLTKATIFREDYKNYVLSALESNWRC